MLPSEQTGKIIKACLLRREYILCLAVHLAGENRRIFKAFL